MEKVHLIFDPEKCVGCYNCLLACQDEHCGNDWLPYTRAQQLHGAPWVRTTRHERGAVPYTEVAFRTEMCRHCENAACEKAFPDAVRRRDDGVVLLDPEKSRGNRALVDACPYGAIVWNEELDTAQKCTMCAHLLDQGWKEPRCVQACPLRALSFVRCSDEEFARMTERQGLKPLNTVPAAKPRLVCRNAWKLESVFVAVAAAEHLPDGTERAVEGADAVLTLNGEEILSGVTDFFGECKLDRLPKNAGELRLEVKKSGYRGVSLPVTVGDGCCDAGVIYLERDH